MPIAHSQGPRGTSETEGNEWMNEKASVPQQPSLPVREKQHRRACLC